MMQIEGSSSGNTIALELARGDLKTGRLGRGRTPLEILAAFCNTGDLDELRLWHEWETATKGRQFTRWSSGARKELLIEDLDDQELADAEVGGELVHEFTADEWHALVGTPGAMAKALRITETHGVLGLRHFLTRVRGRWRRRKELNRAA